MDSISTVSKRMHWHGSPASIYGISFHIERSSNKRFQRRETLEMHICLKCIFIIARILAVIESESLIHTAEIYVRYTVRKDRERR